MVHPLFSAQARDTRRRRRIAEALERVVDDAPASVRGHEARILLIAAVLRSGLALPDDGVRAARALARDRPGSLYVVGPDLPEDLLDVERALGMRGRRTAALAIAAGTIATPTRRRARP